MSINSKYRLVNTIHTFSAEETESLGESIGKTLVRGQVIGLAGDLGAGKTCFTRGLFKGRNQKSKVVVNSPTFVVMQRYEGDLVFYHADVYRLDSKQEFLDLDLFEIASDGVLVVEWADKFSEVFNEKAMIVEFVHQSPSERLIRFYQK